MVALFVVMMIGFFLVVDVVLGARRQAGLQAAVARQAGARTDRSMFVAGFELAPDRSYHPGHTWAKFNEHAVARIGLDEFAARLIGPADDIELPEVGTAVRAGRPLVQVTRRGRRATIVAPVSGIVRATNHAVAEDPKQAAEAPYEGGWLVDIKSDDARVDLKSLRFGDAAHRWLDESATALHRMFSPGLAAAADGGRPVDAISDQLDEAAWRKAAGEFLLSPND
jgi:glycine cleavage system H lipoate-binding protein